MDLCSSRGEPRFICNKNRLIVVVWGKITFIVTMKLNVLKKISLTSKQVTYTRTPVFSRSSDPLFEHSIQDPEVRTRMLYAVNY